MARSLGGRSSSRVLGGLKVSAEGAGRGGEEGGLALRTLAVLAAAGLGTHLGRLSGLQRLQQRHRRLGREILLRIDPWPPASQRTHSHTQPHDTRTRQERERTK